MELIYVLLACLCALDYCQGQDHVYTTNEETGKGHYVGNVPQDLELPPQPANEKPKRNYRIMNGGDKISVDAASGDLATAMTLDREALCPDNPPRCEINVEVLVLPKFRLLNLLFVVEDLNDNPPRFPSQTFTKEISESAVVGSAIRLDSAVDPDLKLNSIQEYRISSSPPSRRDRNGIDVPYFHLDVIQNIDGTKIPQLNLTRGLDREKVDSYELLLYAIDGGSPPLTGTATVQIEVSDSNDNQPTFPQKSYLREIPENLEPGSLIIQVTASDLDAGPNALIEYTFPTVVSAHDRGVFNLNPTTGAITIKKPGLDFENKTIHHLTVEARDRGPNPASAYTTVTVKVLDVNDEAPHIDVSFMEFVEKKTDETGRASVLIREDLANDTYIAFVTVTDRDTGINGRVHCKIRQPSSFELMDLDQEQNRYLIRTKSLLDRETNGYHNIEIIATDSGSPSLTNSTTILVELVDVNDNPPKFDRKKYKVYVSENIGHGEKVTEIVARDPDDGQNAEITYKAEPTLENTVTPFTIDKDSGTVRFANDATLLDAENATEPYRLTVTATDNGDPRLSSTTLLIIYVEDENDNQPKFRQSSYDFKISEDSKRGTYVGQVIADDADVDKTTNARITYRFADDSNEPNPFTLKEETGEIHFDGDESQIDREARDSRPYILTVEAWDNGQEPMEDRATVEIYLEDVNDNSPSIVFPNVTRDMALVYIIPPSKEDAATEDATADDAPTDEEAMDYLLESSALSVAQQVLRIGSSETPMRSHLPKQAPVVVTQIRAVDRDASENGHVRYTLVEGNVNKYFSVDMSSGNITLNLVDEKALRAMKRGCHVIKISVSDLGKPEPMTTPAWVNIYVTDSAPGKVNITDAMRDCQNNSFYPVIFVPGGEDLGSASSNNLLFILIISFVALFLIIIIVAIALLIKHKCKCGKDKKSRTYNCQQAADLYSDHSYTQGSPIVKKGRGSPFGNRTGGLHLPSGTVDSRTSNISEWTASQMQISQQHEKNEMMMRAEQYDGSVGSQNSARDSGTGDSVPNEAYNQSASTFRQPSFQRGPSAYPVQHYQPTHVNLPQDEMPPDYGDHMLDEHGYLTHQYPPHGQMVFTPKCTQECRLYGHGDNCWMPDSLQRPPSRMTSFKGAEGYDDNSLRMPKRAMSPSVYQRAPVDPSDYHGTRPTPTLVKYGTWSSTRYTNAPSSTPFYFDPMSKFEGAVQAPRSKFSTFRDDHVSSDGGSPAQSQVASSNVSRQPSLNSAYRGGHYPANQLQQPARVQSPVIINAASPTPYGAAAQRGKAYVNLQGNEGPIEDAHSNLSGSSSSNQHPDYGYQQQGYPNSYQQHYAMQQASYPVSTAQSHYPAESFPVYGGEGTYEDEFAATNLLLSPVDSEPGDYKQRLEKQMQQQQPYQQSGYTFKGTESSQDEQKLLDEEHQLQEGNVSVDKLSTIREEIDADEVVAGIDELLL